MQTQYYAAASLDGFIATRDHSLEWLFQFGDLEAATYTPFIAARCGILPCGRSPRR